MTTLKFDDTNGSLAWLSNKANIGFCGPDGIFYKNAHEFIGELWNEEHVLLALRLKFAANPIAREHLVTSKEPIVYRLESPRKVNRWGRGLNGRGQNVLGQLLMQVRTELSGTDWCDLLPWTPFMQTTLNENDGNFKVFHAPDAAKIYMNSRYQVVAEEYIADSFERPVTGLSIKRLDRSACRDWRDFQRIKNEITSPTCEACEIYPTEARLVDTANQYHLWVLPEGLHFPFGFTERLVAKTGKGHVVQRPFAVEDIPEDALTGEQAYERVVEKVRAAKETLEG